MVRVVTTRYHQMTIVIYCKQNFICVSVLVSVYMMGTCVLVSICMYVKITCAYININKTKEKETKKQAKIFTVGRGGRRT